MHKSYKRLQQYIERGTGSTNFFQRMLSFLSWRWRKAMSHSLRCSMMLQDSCSSQPPLCKEKKCSGTSGRCHKRFPGTRSTYVNSCGQCFRLWWMLIDVDLCATRDSDLDSSICKKKKSKRMHLRFAKVHKFSAHPMIFPHSWYMILTPFFVDLGILTQKCSVRHCKIWKKWRHPIAITIFRPTNISNLNGFNGLIKGQVYMKQQFLHPNIGGYLQFLFLNIEFWNVALLQCWLYPSKQTNINVSSLWWHIMICNT